MTHSTISEIEIGPHFLTVYGSPKKEHNILLASAVYDALRRRCPALYELQSETLRHYPGDPAIYHPYGEPNNFKEVYGHFHVRYMYKPSAGDINALLGLLEELGAIQAPDFKVTEVGSNKLEEYKDYKYPEFTGSTKEEYFEYMAKMKRNHPLGLPKEINT